MSAARHTRLAAATVVLAVLVGWFAAPDAGARDRKKKKETVSTTVQEPQRQKISITLDLAELRDSIAAQEERYDREFYSELREYDEREYESMMDRLRKATVMSSVFGASSGSYLGDLAVDIAKEHLGKPYVWGAEGPDSFDCSGFMMFVYRQVGIRLPRTSREQFLLGEEVDIPDLRKGDLVFWSGRRGSVGATIGHVGMVSDVDYEHGRFYFIHANSSNKGVSISRSDERYFMLHYKGARRIIPLDNKR